MAIAQDDVGLHFLERPDSLHPVRFWTSAGAGALTYTGVMIGLNEIWYADFERSRFQFFNDLGEWHDMDKMGHAFTAYMESHYIYQGARWTGMKERPSIWLGVAMGSLFQASIEILDAHSAKWGFSVPDIAFNTAGCAIFAGQQLAWGEQRILLKVSSTRPSYPDYRVRSVDGGRSMLLSERADELFGRQFPETFIKDYNGQTIWASINLHAFFAKSDSKLPPWLNVAVGYGAQNMYGGFENEWTDDDGILYRLDDDIFPRYQQFYLSLDIDLSRIKTKSRWLKTIFSVLNIIKIPAPALEVNTLGNVRFHPIYF